MALVMSAFGVGRRTDVPLNDDDVREILRIIDESDLDELRIETGELSLHVVRAGAAVPPPERAPAAAATRSRRRCSGRSTVRRRPASRPSSTSAPCVEPDTIVCIIEVMKMMNSVHAGVAGTIAEVCVENGQPVEYGTRLFRVEP